MMSQMTPERILIVEDAPDTRAGLRAALEEVAGYTVSDVGDGAKALPAFLSVRPHLVLVDIGLPGMNGFDLCERMREMAEVPVIVFSASRDTEAKLEAFRRGADDFVVKDAPLDELLARIEAALRRARLRGPDLQEVGVYSDSVLRLDAGQATVTVRGLPAELTPIEYTLLTHLVQHPGQPFTAAQLAHRVWGPEYGSEDQVKWHIGRLRRKIERDPAGPELVVTRRGFGYSYVPPATSRSPFKPHSG